LVAWLGVSLLLSAVGVDHRFIAFRPRGSWGASQAQGGVVFASSHVDLKDLKPGEVRHLGVVFGEATLHYDPNVPVRVRTSTAFGATAFPDGSVVAFGGRTFTTPGTVSSEPVAEVDVDTVFGSTRFVADSKAAAE
jgi:hypothetical protein